MSARSAFAKVVRSPFFYLPVAALGVGGTSTAVNMAVNHDLNTEAAVQDDTTEAYRERMERMQTDIGSFNYRSREFEADAERFTRDLLLDESINEREYYEFAKYFPDYASPDMYPRMRDADSLDECRLQENVATIAANDQAIAENIASCMSKNNMGTGWLTALMIVLSAAGFSFGIGKVENSERLRRWASEKPTQRN